MSRTNRTEKYAVDIVIDQTLDDIRQYPPGTPEHRAAIDTLVTLAELKTKMVAPRVSPDVMANVVGNLLGIGIIVGYERMHIFTTKATHFLKRLT